MSFRKRFFRWFGVFRVLKFLNYAHREIYSRQAVAIAARKFLRESDPAFSGGRNALELLEYLRGVQRTAGM